MFKTIINFFKPHKPQPIVSEELAAPVEVNTPLPAEPPKVEEVVIEKPAKTPGVRKPRTPSKITTGASTVKKTTSRKVK
jgi:hypothetical protein